MPRHELTRDEQQAGGIASGAARRAKRDAARALAIERLADRLVAADTALDAALADEDTALRLRAAVQVYDRVLGRPTQAVEVTGPDGDPVQLDHRGVNLDDILRVAREAGVQPGDGDG